MSMYLQIHVDKAAKKGSAALVSKWRCNSLAFASPCSIKHWCKTSIMVPPMQSPTRMHSFSSSCRVILEGCSRYTSFCKVSSPMAEECLCSNWATSTSSSRRMSFKLQLSACEHNPYSYWPRRRMNARTCAALSHRGSNALICYSYMHKYIHIS